MIRESTKQTNKRVAEQMEAARKSALAKGEVGIRDRAPVPTLRQFAESDFATHIRSTFANKNKTQSFYENRMKNILPFNGLANQRLNDITGDRVAEYIAHRREAKGKHGRSLQVSSLNRELQVLRRLFHLAMEWGKVDKPLPKVRMVPGEKHRERVLTSEEEALYFRAAASDAMKQSVENGRHTSGHTTETGEIAPTPRAATSI